jgi:uncharacterized protein (PEP-CTERM system associated)
MKLHDELKPGPALLALCRTIYFYAFAAIFSAAIFCCSDAYAADVLIRPSISLSEEYDDNIFLAKDNTTADYVTRVAPSVSIAYKTEIWDLALKDTFHWWYYAKQRKGYYSNDGSLSSKLVVLRNFFYLDVLDTYSSVVLNPRGPSTESNLNINRTDSNVLNATPYMKYQIDPSTAATPGFAYTNIWYRSGGGVNRQQYKGFLELEHGFGPRFNALLHAEYLADRPADINPNDDQTAVSLSLFYTLDPKTKIDGTAGYRWINFSDSLNHNSAEYNVGVAYQLPAKGKVELRASQSVSFSATQGSVQNMLQQLTASYGESLSVNGRIYHARDNYFEIGQTNDAWGAAAGVAYAPDSRRTYRISGRYEKGRFLPQDEDRKVYGASVGIEYRLTATATLSLADDYTKSSGQLDSDNFIDNIVALQLRIAL